MNWKPFGDIQNSAGQDPALTSKLGSKFGVGHVLSRGLDQVTHGGPFQPKLFSNSVVRARALIYVWFKVQG